MEKVVIVSSVNHIPSAKADEVNKYLDKGWTVKEVRTVSTRDCTTAVFVLEKA